MPPMGWNAGPPRMPMMGGPPMPQGVCAILL